MYDSDQHGKVSASYNKIAQIILGRDLTLEESHYYQTQAEWNTTSPEDYMTGDQYLG